MRLVQMHAENFKRVQLVDITPDGPITTIGGDNEQGKSSTLDAFEWALEGPQKDTPLPIREGADKSVVILEFDDLTVRRTQTEKGQSLILHGKDGARFPSPQAMLDKLFSRIANDPLAFINMKPEAQRDTLKQLARLDFTEMDDERKALFEQRTELGRDEKRLTAAVEAIVVSADTPATKVSIADLAESLKVVENEHGILAICATCLKNDQEALAQQQIRMNELLAEVKKLEAQIDAKRGSLDASRQAFNEQQEKVAALDDADTLRRVLVDAEAINRKVDQAEARKAGMIERDQVAAAIATLTAQIESIDTTKQMMLKQATFPLPGLSLTDDGVLYRGIPLTQVCKSDQIRIGVAVALALNPKLRVMLIRDGSLIGPERRKLLEQLAQEHDAQILMEVVTTNASEVSVLIEDGRVVGVGEVVLS